MKMIGKIIPKNEHTNTLKSKNKLIGTIQTIIKEKIRGHNKIDNNNMKPLVNLILNEDIDLKGYLIEQTKEHAIIFTLEPIFSFMIIPRDKIGLILYLNDSDSKAILNNRIGEKEIMLMS